MKSAFRLLMDANEAPNLQTGFKTMSIYYFFDDMIKGLAFTGNKNYPKLEEESIEILFNSGSEAYKLLSEVKNETSISSNNFPDSYWKDLFGESFLSELLLSARMTRFVGSKGRLSFKILNSLTDPNTKTDDLLGFINEIRFLYREFLSIRRDFEEVWVLRAEEIGIDGCLSIFDRVGVQMSKTVAWLAKQAERLYEDKLLDSKLESYTASDDYKILWISDFKNMWDRAYPWQ